MKVLLLDKETSGMVGMVTTFSDSISKEVFMVTRIDDESKKQEDDKKQAMHHLKAVVLVRPCGSSLDAIVTLLKHPKFSAYHLFFYQYTDTGATADVGGSG